MDSNYQAHLSESDVDDIVNQILAEETQLFEKRTSMFKAVTDDDIKRANAQKQDVEHAVKGAGASKLYTKRAETTAADTTPPIDTNPVQAKPVRTVASDVIHDAEPTSTFTDAEALQAYATHPAHVAVADGKVRPYTKIRSCRILMTAGIRSVIMTTESAFSS